MRTAYLPLKDEEDVIQEGDVCFPEGNNSVPYKHIAPFIGCKYSAGFFKPTFRPITIPDAFPEWVRFEERLPTEEDAVNGWYLCRAPDGDSWNIAAFHCHVFARLKTGCTEWLSGLNSVQPERKGEG